VAAVEEALRRRPLMLFGPSPTAGASMAASGPGCDPRPDGGAQLQALRTGMAPDRDWVEVLDAGMADARGIRFWWRMGFWPAGEVRGGRRLSERWIGGR
jgi:hypothetical protein